MLFMAKKSNNVDNMNVELETLGGNHSMGGNEIYSDL